MKINICISCLDVLNLTVEVLRRELAELLREVGEEAGPCPPLQRRELLRLVARVLGVDQLRQQELFEL